MTATTNYRQIFDRLKKRLETVYGLIVTVGPVEGIYIGQFDGKEFWIDLERDEQDAVFTLVHLFGHTIQWNTDEKLRALASNDTVTRMEDLPAVYQYERQASQYGLALLHEIGECGLARWLTDSFASDWKFLEHFYRTGEKVRFDISTGTGEPLLTPLAIPSFTPRRWPPRGAF